MMKKTFILILLLHLACLNSFSTECIKLFRPFKAGLKHSELLVYCQIIRVESDGKALLKVIERYKGTCADTITCYDMVDAYQERAIVILSEFRNGGNPIYYPTKCVASTLFINQTNNSVSGNIRYCNAMICRLSAFFRIYKYPKNTMSLKKINKIIRRKTYTT
jgi:hypothetical protein